MEEKTRVWGKQGAEGWEWDLVLWWGWRRERWVRKVEGKRKGCGVRGGAGTTRVGLSLVVVEGCRGCGEERWWGNMGVEEKGVRLSLVGGWRWKGVWGEEGGERRWRGKHRVRERRERDSILWQGWF